MDRGSSVLLTGASSGIGKSITEKLLADGFTVYGIGRDFSHTAWDGEAFSAGEKENAGREFFKGNFCPVRLDLLDEEKLERQVTEIIRDARKRGKPIRVLVNNAGTAWYGLHEEIKGKEIREMVRVNLEVPMILTQMFLRQFKEYGREMLVQGRAKREGQAEGPEEIWPTVINISSVTAVSYENTHGACYGATKAGLLSFGRSIFGEARKNGVRVTTILPDMTDTNLYRDANFEADTEFASSLLPEDTADAVMYVLHQPAGVVIPELMIRPQLHRIRKK